MARKALAVLALLVCAGALVAVERAPEKPLAQQPFPDAAEYADAARSLAAGDGFYTDVHAGGPQPPRYPPGFSMALTPFALVGDHPRAMQRGAKAYALLYVAAAVLAAWVLGGPLAALLAGIFVWASPFAQDAAGLVMSDAFVAALAVLTLALLAPVRPASARLAGALSGMAALARLTAGVQAIAVLAAVPRQRWKDVVLCGLPFLVVLLLTQWAIFGSPLRTGYDYWGVDDHVFALGNLTSGSVLKEGPNIFADRLHGDLLDGVCPCPPGGPEADLPNVAFYPAVLFGGFWIFGPPLVGLLGLGYAVARWRTPVGRYALVLVGGSFALFAVYLFQGSRFVAGPATVLTVLGAVALAEIAEALGDRVRRRRSVAQPAV